MAVVQINQPFTSADLDPYEGSVSSVSPTQIVVTNGTYEAVLGGQFGYDASGATGTLQTLSLTSNGQSVLEASGLNYPVATLQDYIEAGQFEQGLASVLAGDDSITGSSGPDTIFAGTGSDTVESGQGDDVVFGGQGDYADYLRLGQGNDQAYGGEGDDRLDGGADNDILGGGLGADSIDGGAGNDAIYGGQGDYADRIRGGGGDDTIYAGAGNDTVSGNEGNDTVGGGAGADVLRGGSGDDVVYLGANDGAADVFQTGSNDEQGSGVGNGNDTVYAFENGVDHIDVSDSGITQLSQLVIGSAADGDAVITLASGQSVTLDGVAQSDLDASDFIFA